MTANWPIVGEFVDRNAIKPTPVSKWMSVRSSVQYVKGAISKDEIYRLVQNGTLVSTRVGDKILIDRDSLDVECDKNALPQHHLIGLAASKMTRVYFIENTDSAAIKIGSTDNIKQRLKSLQSANACLLELLGSIPGDSRAEMQIHRKFAGLRIRGEWFKAEEHLLKFVYTVCDQHQDLTAQEFGHRYRIREDEVWAMIQSGELEAIDMGASRVPRYMITPQARRKFEDSHRVIVPPEPATRQKLSKVKDYFPDI